MPGDHSTLLREPHVGAIASVLQRHLDRVQPIDRSFAAVSMDHAQPVAGRELSLVGHEELVSEDLVRATTISLAMKRR